MKTDGAVSRFLRWSKADRRLVVEAFVTLARVRLVLAFFPFASAMERLGLQARTMSDQTAEVGRETRQGIAPVRTAIRRATRVAPFRTVCLQQAIAASLMLERRGLPTAVYFGVARDNRTALQAHAWSICHGTVVTGGHVRNQYAEIAIFVPRIKSGNP